MSPPKTRRLTDKLKRKTEHIITSVFDFQLSPEKVSIQVSFKGIFLSDRDIITQLA